MGKKYCKNVLVVIALKQIMYAFWVIFISYNFVRAQNEPLKIQVGIYDENVEIDNRFAISESQRIWINALKNRTGDERLTKAIVETNFYSTNKMLIENLKSKNYDIITVSCLDYFEYNMDQHVEPILVSSYSNSSKFERYYLITNVNSKINNLKNIDEGAKIIIPKTNSFKLIKDWIKVLLAENFNKKKHETFRIEDSNENEINTLLSIFFNKSDLAIIRESTYNDAIKLNHQIKKQTKILSISGNYLSYILVQRHDINKELFNKIWDQATSLSTYVEGQQILDILKIKKIYPIAEQDLYETKELFRKYNSLFK